MINDKITILYNIRALAGFTYLYDSLDKYQYVQTEDSEFKLMTNAMIYFNTDLPLPSGNTGSPLAVAMEMHKYIGALYLLNNAGELGINLANISHDNMGEVYSAKDVLYMSAMSDDTSELLKEDMPNNLGIILERNSECFNELKRLLSKNRVRKNEK